jgi:hypothetical protein
LPDPDGFAAILPHAAKENPKIASFHSLFKTANPGMVLFRPDGKFAFVPSSFTPEMDVIDTTSYKLQVDSGKLAVTKGTTQAIHGYAELIDSRLSPNQYPYSEADLGWILEGPIHEGRLPG